MGGAGGGMRERGRSGGSSRGGIHYDYVNENLLLCSSVFATDCCPHGCVVVPAVVPVQYAWLNGMSSGLRHRARRNLLLDVDGSEVVKLSIAARRVPFNAERLCCLLPRFGRKRTI